jgi:E3 ubiquitin-protein ligase DOA10
MEDKVCVVCLESEGELLTPCSCKGTTSYHKACLFTTVKYLGRKCTICNEKFKVKGIHEVEYNKIKTPLKVNFFGQTLTTLDIVQLALASIGIMIGTFAVLMAFTMKNRGGSAVSTMEEIYAHEVGHFSGR